jgi:predicted nucleic acid-binding Zn ribbon protein
MARRVSQWDDEDEPELYEPDGTLVDGKEDDPDAPDAWDQDQHDEPSIVPCPYCRKAISEDAETCHHCGQWMSAEDAPTQAQGRSMLVVWIVVLLIAVLAAGWMFSR